MENVLYTIRIRALSSILIGALIILNSFDSFFNDLWLCIGLGGLSAIFIYGVWEIIYQLTKSAVKYKLHLVSFVSYVLIISALYTLFAKVLVESLLNGNVFIDEFISENGQLFLLIIGVLSGFHFLIKSLSFWGATKAEEEEEKVEELEAKFDSLKSKNILEFLRKALKNTINLIKEKPSFAIIQIEKLTVILRYLLVSRDEDYVPLKDEIKNGVNFSKLHELQSGRKVMVDLDIDNEFDEIRIPPFVIQLVLDNIFIQTSLSELKVELYIENEVYLVIKSNKGTEMASSSQSYDNLVTNLSQRYALIKGSASVSVISTKSNNLFKLPLISSI